MTLLAPLKHLTALKLSQLSILISAASFLENYRPKPPVVDELEELAILPSTPNEILEQIGADLRQLREQSHLSIEDISARTHIQPRLLQAIEEGQIELLPEPVYVKGMVKRYGDSLGLDGTAISQQVPNWTQGAASFEPLTKIQVTGFNHQATGFGSQTSGFGVQTTELGSQKTGFGRSIRIQPFYIYLGYTLAIVGIGASTSHFLNNAIGPQHLPANGVVVQPHPATPIVAIPVTSAQSSQLPDVKIQIEVKSPTWVQIGIDGTTKLTGNLNVGTKFDWTAKKQVTINTSNAGGLVISRDSQPPQPVGKIGEKQSVTIKVGKY